MKVHGLPAFTTGERALLFLRHMGSPAWSLVGMGQGRRPLRFDKQRSLWLAAGSDRSAAVALDASGRMQPAGAQPDMPLDDLRQRVRTLVKR